MKAVTLRDIAQLGLPETADSPRRLRLMTAAGFQAWQDDADAALQGWISANAFAGKAGASLLLMDGVADCDAIGIIDDVATWDGAKIAGNLPPAIWEIDEKSDATIDQAGFALGWALAQYRFGHFRDGDDNIKPASQLVLPGRAPADSVTPHAGSSGGRRAIVGLARGVSFCRDLINMPPNHMTPAGLEAAARHLAGHHKAAIDVISGVELEDGFPAINTVGRAAGVAPRLIDVRWGKTGPKITLVGKGITFDSGGLDLKPSKAMELMKKDMGGAATVLGLGAAIMESDLAVQLRILVPAAENAVSAQAMRPLDVIDTRAGIDVEVGNTDAEGRLVLADALTLACEEDPDFIIDFATLTGAARVALGTELPAFFCNMDNTAEDLLAASHAVNDPLWRLPLFDAYERHLDNGYVTLSSTGGSGYGGAITAALFLRRFAGRHTNWAHVDVMAWNLESRPGRPKGGEAMGLRALYHHIARLAEAG